ncbi:MAG: hypothetical protein CL524_12035 [Aequorivita sp.]|nr:hypothetical protein [Aequorivita sp.]|tara:strand:+ start:768 stop:1013 length:246 start_codon:yes stop_codon:yes gene_type:complete
MKITDPTRHINAENWHEKFKKFAHRHGLLESEVGRHESRTMAYRTKYPDRAARVKYARKLYGNPDAWVNWAKSDGTKSRPK